MTKLMLKARSLLVAVLGAGLLLAGATTAQAIQSGPAAQSEQALQKPTIVLLHGAYAGRSRWR